VEEDARVAKKRPAAKKPRPTLPEAEEFVRQSDEAVFGAGPPGFVSKHRFGPTDVIGRLHAIDWFARCGEPGAIDLTMEVDCATSWAQVNKELKARARETAWLEAQNQLSAFLSAYHRERDRQWNKFADKFTTALRPLRERVWQPTAERHGLDTPFVSSIEWVTRLALMENEFMDCAHTAFFGLELLTVFEAGHLPCGWRGKWPQGKLVVF
jgi:hypothetical protein